MTEGQIRNGRDPAQYTADLEAGLRPSNWTHLPPSIMCLIVSRSGGETSAGDMIVVSAFESPAVVAGLDDVAVMGQPIEQRGGHLGVPEHTGPLAEGKVGRDDYGCPLIEPADEVEQKLATGLGEGQISELVQDDEVHPGQMLGKPALRSVAGLGLPDG